MAAQPIMAESHIIQPIINIELRASAAVTVATAAINQIHIIHNMPCQKLKVKNVKIGIKPDNFLLFPDQFSNLKCHIGENDPWISVHSDMIKRCFKNFCQFYDISLVDKR